MLDNRPPARAVVFGATGLIGRHLVDQLLARGTRVVEAGRRPSGEGDGSGFRPARGGAEAGLETHGRDAEADWARHRPGAEAGLAPDGRSAEASRAPHDRGAEAGRGPDGRSAEASRAAHDRGAEAGRGPDDRGAEAGRGPDDRSAEAGRAAHDRGAGAPPTNWTFEAVDFERLVEDPDAGPACLRGDPVVFIALGTTRKSAGSREAFRRVDLTYVRAAATAARRAGVNHLLAVSSVGAKPSASTFYLRVKAEAEEALMALGFPSLTLVRPSLLVGERPQPRPGELWSARAMAVARPFLRGPFERYRPIEARVVARALVRLAADPPHGVAVFESHHLASLGA